MYKVDTTRSKISNTNYIAVGMCLPLLYHKKKQSLRGVGMCLLPFNGLKLHHIGENKALGYNTISQSKIANTRLQIANIGVFTPII